jgi:hypothetical protein
MKYKLRALGEPEGILDGEWERAREKLPPPEEIGRKIISLYGRAQLVRVYECRPCRGAFYWPEPWAHCPWYSPSAAQTSWENQQNTQSVLENWIEARSRANVNAKFLMRVVKKCREAEPFDLWGLTDKGRELLLQALEEAASDPRDCISTGLREHYWKLRQQYEEQIREVQERAG